MELAVIGTGEAIVEGVRLLVAGSQ